MSDKLIDKSHIGYAESIYPLPPRFSNGLGNEIFYSAIKKLDRYYLPYGFPVEIGFQNSILIREIIKNARWHGGSKDLFPTSFGLFINPEGFVVGCNDGGDYFKREDIREIWENKKELREFHKDNGPPGPHFGYSYFKTKLDEIKIDTNQGTFYGIVNINRCIEEINNLSKK